MSPLTWLLESDLFDAYHELLASEAERAGHRVRVWRDAWWDVGFPAGLSSGAVAFHGSLGNAARIDQALAWWPGALCPVDNFSCRAYYAGVGTRLLQRGHRFTTALAFVTDAPRVAQELGGVRRVFVRPDSPLKAFSGRVVDPATVTLADLDHGFYYDDPELPIVVAPERMISDEWRFVVVGKRIAAGSHYLAATRSASQEPAASATAAIPADVWTYAEEAAAGIPAPAPVYVLDICRSHGSLYVLELGPFGGADLYACDPRAVVEAVAAVAETEPLV